MIFGIEAVVFLLILLISFLFWDKRYKKPQEEIPDGYEKTGEINIDPISGEKSRVYYHKKTGERLYIKEK